LFFQQLSHDMFIAGLAPKYILLSLCYVLYVFVYKSIYQSRKKLPTIFCTEQSRSHFGLKIVPTSQSTRRITD